VGCSGALEKGYSIFYFITAKIYTLPFPGSKGFFPGLYSNSSTAVISGFLEDVFTQLLWLVSLAVS